MLQVYGNFTIQYCDKNFYILLLFRISNSRSVENFHETQIEFRLMAMAEPCTSIGDSSSLKPLARKQISMKISLTFMQTFGACLLV